MLQMYADDLFTSRSEESELLESFPETDLTKSYQMLGKFTATGSAFTSFRNIRRIDSTSTNDESSVSFSLIERKRAGYHGEDDFLDTNTPNCSGVGEDHLRRPDVVTSYRTPGVYKFRRRASLEPQIDFFSHCRVPNECILNIFRFLNKRDLINSMRVSKRFYNVGQTSELWQSLDLSNHTVRISDIYRILARGCKVLRMCGTMTIDDDDIEGDSSSSVNAPSLDFAVKLTHLDMSRSDVPVHFTQNVLSSCSELKCLSLENCELNVHICHSLSANVHLTHLDISMTKGLSAHGLQLFLPKCTRLEELNISWCELDMDAVQTVCSLVTPNILKLNISGTKDKNALLDEHVLLLTDRCRHLIELDLSDSPLITRDALEKVLLLEMRSLQTLSLSRCFGIHPLTFLQCVSISRLNIFGCVTDEGEATLRSRLPDTVINHSPFSHVARPTPPPSVTSIWGVKTKDIY